VGIAGVIGRNSEGIRFVQDVKKGYKAPWKIISPQVPSTTNGTRDRVNHSIPPKLP